MAKRLIKIAKELNVGTSVIVDFLVDKGFEIENKPTAKVSDEMIAELTKEFQGSMDIKKEADELIIGVRPPAKKEEVEPVQGSLFQEPKLSSNIPSYGSKRLIKVAKELDIGTSTIVDFLVNNGFDIENKPTAKVSDEMYDELIKEFQKTSQMVRSETPQLKGLKILGKIDTDKLKKPIKKEQENTDEPKRRIRKRKKVSINPDNRDSENESDG